MSERGGLWNAAASWLARHFTRDQILMIRRVAGVAFLCLSIAWIAVFLRG